MKVKITMPEMGRIYFTTEKWEIETNNLEDYWCIAVQLQSMGYILNVESKS